MKYSHCGGSSEDVSRENDLQSALDAMLAVLRCVNDSMHQVAITGYQVFIYFKKWTFLMIFIRITALTNRIVFNNLIGKSGRAGQVVASRRI